MPNEDQTKEQPTKKDELEDGELENVAGGIADGTSNTATEAGRVKKIDSFTIKQT